MRFIQRWPRAAVVLGNLPGASILALNVVTWRQAGRFDAGHVDASLFLWPAIGVGLVWAAAGILWLGRITWLPLAAIDIVLAGSAFAGAVFLIVAEVAAAGAGGLEGTLPWAVGGFLLLGIAFVVATLGVVADRRRSRELAEVGAT